MSFDKRKWEQRPIKISVQDYGPDGGPRCDDGNRRYRWFAWVTQDGFRDTGTHCGHTREASVRAAHQAWRRDNINRARK
jgi:hypothetical protein